MSQDWTDNNNDGKQNIIIKFTKQSTLQNEGL